MFGKEITLVLTTDLCGFRAGQGETQQATEDLIIVTTAILLTVLSLSLLELVNR